MGLFNKIFGKSNTIKVQFIDSSNGNVIGVSEMPPEQLPETFEIQTTMHLNDEDWSIQEAIPAHSKEFLQSKNLTLKMTKVEKMNPNDIWYSTPTISNEFPQIIEKTKETENDISIHEDDYRQREFLNVNSNSQIKEEFKAIKEIWTNHSKKSEEYTLFKNCHVRKTIGLPNLSIDFNELQTILNSNSVGQVIINGETLVNGFSFKTDDTTYFGTLDNEKVVEFCISQWNNNSKNEILKINKEFNLQFVDWFNCDLIENE
tara:strand:- start:418 stop:1197 length:780 start_codon:yes stop_codon:yes gene_type:complete